MPYPSYHSLIEKLAAKVVSRVVTDGLNLGDALKETIRYADLNKQQVIHMCSILQDYGMVYNGDHRSYFSYTEDLGKGVPLSPNGYVVYANKNNRNLDRIFDSISNLRKAGFDDENIIEFNPDLKEIMTVIDGIERSYKEIVDDIKRKDLEGENKEDAPVAEHVERYVDEDSTDLNPPVDEEVSVEELQQAASWAKKFLRTAQEDVEVQEATPENVKNALEEGNAPEEDVVEEGDLGDEEFAVEEGGLEDLGGEEGGDVSVGGASVSLRKGPDYFQSKLEKAPKWDVNNILSIEIARNHYDNLKKELEEIVFNENLEIGEDVMSQFNDVRSSIDEASEKIKDAQKETEKIEDKQQEVEEEFSVDEGAPEEAPAEDQFAGLEEEPSEEEIQIEEEAPTDEMIVEEEK